VYEVTRDRLYLASTGSDCYFICVKRIKRETQFESAIKEAVQASSVSPQQSQPAS
jgi:hypothetical protein